MSGFIKSNISRAGKIDTFHPATSSSTTSSTISLPVIVPSLPLPGTRSWLHGLSLVSSGSVDLDVLILNGGFFLHSMIGIEEDRSSQIWRCVMKGFIADGIHYQQQVIVISGADSISIADTLPSTSTIKSTSTSISTASTSSMSTSTSPSKSAAGTINSNGTQLKIAWRYGQQSLTNTNIAQPSTASSSSSPSSSTPSRGPSLSRHYDFSSLSSSHSDKYTRLIVPRGDTQMAYADIYNQLLSILSSSSSNRRVTRIILQSLGDIDWNYETAEQSNALLTFLSSIRALCSRYDVVCLFSFPAHLYTPAIQQSIFHLAHYSFYLRSLTSQSIYGDYDALLSIGHLSHLHSFNPIPFDQQHFLIQMKQQLIIHKLSLPPEHIQEEESKSATSSSSSSLSIIDDQQLHHHHEQDKKGHRGTIEMESSESMSHIAMLASDKSGIVSNNKGSSHSISRMNRSSGMSCGNIDF